MPAYKKGQEWNKSKDKLMLDFEKSTGKSAIRGGKITGQFEYWCWQQSNQAIKSKTKPKAASIQKAKSKSAKEASNKAWLEKMELKEMAKRQSDLEIKGNISKSTKRVPVIFIELDKQNDYKYRVQILDLLYNNLFYDTKALAEELGIPVNLAYKHAKWLEDHNLIYGNANDNTGVSMSRGKARIHSILWEPKYSEESCDSWTIYEKELRKAMKI